MSDRPWQGTFSPWTLDQSADLATERLYFTFAASAALQVRFLRFLSYPRDPRLIVSAVGVHRKTTHLNRGSHGKLPNPRWTKKPTTRHGEDMSLAKHFLHGDMARHYNAWKHREGSGFIGLAFKKNNSNSLDMLPQLGV
jgi:hypothetical protein